MLRRDEVTGEWRKLHKKELCDVYCSHKKEHCDVYCSQNDRPCGLVVRVSGYRYRVLEFDSRRYQIF